MITCPDGNIAEIVAADASKIRNWLDSYWMYYSIITPTPNSESPALPDEYFLESYTPTELQFLRWDCELDVLWNVHNE